MIVDLIDFLKKHQQAVQVYCIIAIAIMLVWSFLGVGYPPRAHLDGGAYSRILVSVHPHILCCPYLLFTVAR